MAKCGDCGRFINPSRGYCSFYVCHNKLIGGPKPDIPKARASWHRDFKRCPFCAGERDIPGKCFISACNRGPNGTNCGCHYQMARMGNPGQEMRAIIHSRHLGVQAGGGARIVC